MKIKILFLSALLSFTGIMANAATKAEMDQARAIAAKFYLRFANNGSDYLDAINPTSMADLEARLKPAEVENLKWFKNASTPSDYAAWNKEDLVKYWSNTFFSDNSSAAAEGKQREAAVNTLAHKQISQAIGKMTVTAQAQEVQPETPTPQEMQQTAQQENAEAAVVTDDKTELENQIAALEQQMEEEPLEPQKKESSGLWVYIMVLCILVAIVIALVVYAAHTMKLQKKKKEELESRVDKEDEDEAVRFMPAPGADSDRMREKYAAELAKKNEEITTLKRSLAEADKTIEQLTAQLSALSRRKPQAAPETARTEQPAGRARREVFLGRVNESGVFIRADRDLNPGHTIYRLLTTNGLTGTFEVVDDQVSVALALENPEKWLAKGCAAKDINDTYDREFIITDNPGTAIFEDGAWRVLRKAKIHYE